MSKVRLYGDTSGYVDLKAPDVASDVTITLPNTTGPFATETYVDGAVSGLATETYVDNEIAAIPEIAGIGSNVVQAVKTNTFSTTSSTYTTVTGLTVTITPSSASSKVLLIAQVALGSDDSSVPAGSQIRIFGGNAGSYIGDASGSRERAIMYWFSSASGLLEVAPQQSAVYLDSPATSSPVTYGVQARRSSSTNTALINRSRNDANNDRYGRLASSITAIEVAA